MFNCLRTAIRNIRRVRKLEALLKTALGKDAVISLTNSLKIEIADAHRLLQDLAEYDQKTLKILLQLICQGSRDGFIGNPACQYNAHSAYLRCAVKPSGPCIGCEFCNVACDVNWDISNGN